LRRVRRQPPVQRDGARRARLPEAGLERLQVALGGLQGVFRREPADPDPGADEQEDEQPGAERQGGREDESATWGSLPGGTPISGVRWRSAGSSRAAQGPPQAAVGCAAEPMVTAAAGPAARPRSEGIT
ncbi:MAG: hypothetical protein ACTHJL_07540, partial [Amnibacterium sp.]